MHLLPSTTTGGFPSSVVVVVDRNMIETHHQKAIECFADTLTLFEIVKSVTMIILDCFYWTSLQFVQTSLLSSTLYNAQSDALESAGEREGKSMLCCSPVRPLFGTTTALITATSAKNAEAAGEIVTVKPGYVRQISVQSYNQKTDLPSELHSEMKPNARAFGMLGRGAASPSLIPRFVEP